MPGFRQEVLNVLLAQVLVERGVVAAPENILTTSAGKRKMPDVLVEYQGLRVMIEGEIASAQAQAKAKSSANKRVEDGIAHIGVAVVYPLELRDAAFATVKDELIASTLDIAIITESDDTGFVQGDVDYLERALRTAFDHLIEEDVVEQAVAAIDAGVEYFAASIAPLPGSVGRIAEVLGIQMDMQQVTREQRAAVCRIGGLVVSNAMIFQELLSQNSNQVDALTVSIAHGDIDIASDFCDHWNFIIQNINYYPIFHLARLVLLHISANMEVEKALKRFADIARKVVIQRAALRHDLMGRIYHRLLADAKYLGTYYTRIPSAALLLKLALYKANGGVSWHDLDAVGTLRIADLSCGTGTLLTAAADALLDNYIHASVDANQPVDLDSIQKVLLEQVLYGYDVLPSAIHLTASTLALRAPQTTIGRMCLYCLPHAGEHHRLGSIEFLKGTSIQMHMDLFGSSPKVQQVTGQQDEELTNAPLPMLDLCAINPPFTRSTGGNLLFGSATDAERSHMQKDLQKLVQQQGIQASITAGLGSVFIALADRYIKPGGRLALVIPKALLSGIAWKKTRTIISQGYHIEFLITSQDPQRWNFSESTSLSEIMLVAVKHYPKQRGNGDNGGNGGNENNEHTESNGDNSTDKPDNGMSNGDNSTDNATLLAPPTTVINFWHNPDTPFEAMAAARQLILQDAPDLETGQGALNLQVGKHKTGEALSVSAQIMQHDWMLPCTFAQSDLIRAAYHLQQGNFWLPGYGEVGEIPLCPLQKYGALGADRRDIMDGFDRSESQTPYPTFWGHKTEAIETIAQSPNQFLSPLASARPRRPLRNVQNLWQHAGKVLVPERISITTNRLLALRLTQPVLSNMWWELSGIPSDTVEKALALWFNSTLGILLLLTYRTDTNGPWINFKKLTLLKMPVLDTNSLSLDKLAALESAYDQVCSQPLLRIPQIKTDPVRAHIDASIAQALGLPDIAPVRSLLASEPLISKQRLG